MKRALMAVFGTAAVVLATAASAHHSFAVYDMQHEVTFKGVVDTVQFRNPHMAMTLKHEKPDGTKEIIHFVEGAPANMLVRMGLTPEMIKPGQEITAIGAPRKDDPNAYFLKSIILPDGKRFDGFPAARPTAPAPE
jgi:hypothetical protein